MNPLHFDAPELLRDGTFAVQHYAFVPHPTVEGRWRVVRGVGGDASATVEFGPHLRVLPTVCCGICSTDLAKPFMPFPLPQIVGHEVVVRVPFSESASGLAVVEINAGHSALRTSDAELCPYCCGANCLFMATQCPSRSTLGIDRLPGGFAPFVLAPVDGIVPVPSGISAEAAMFTEPFAAALHAVESTPPLNGEEVAVVGPRRLGLLLIAALSARRSNAAGCSFRITALTHARGGPIWDIAKALGCDSFDTSEAAVASGRRFGVVFDTSGTESGLRASTALATRVVHLKSTPGVGSLGLDRLSDLVVDELWIVPLDGLLGHRWPQEAESRNPTDVWVSESVPETAVESLRREAAMRSIATVFHRVGIAEAKEMVRGRGIPGSKFGKFDAAVVTSEAEVDAVVAGGLVRARGAIGVAAHSPPLARSEVISAVLSRNVTLATTRCGRFPKALSVMSTQREMLRTFTDRLITHRAPLRDISDAFALARSPNHIKVCIDTEAADSHEGR